MEGNAGNVLGHSQQLSHKRREEIPFFTSGGRALLSTRAEMGKGRGGTG